MYGEIVAAVKLLDFLNGCLLFVLLLSLQFETTTITPKPAVCVPLPESVGLLQNCDGYCFSIVFRIDHRRFDVI